MLTPHQQRPYSPGPRRPSNLGPGTTLTRQNYSPRSSSLSLPLNGSVSSLTASSSRPTNSSALRQSTVASTPEEFPGPLDVLRLILGPHNGVSTVADLSTVVDQNEDLKNLDLEGLSLTEYASSNAEPVISQNVNGATDHLALDDYVKQEERLGDLHRSIAACDSVLSSVESYLTSFQADLGAVSSEIELLQTRSTALNTRLENRKVVKNLLAPSVEQVIISPLVVKTLVERPIDESWVQALHEFEKKRVAVESKSKDDSSVKAAQDARPLLQNLADKAVERIRDFIVTQIKALRSPNINAQIIQQKNFLPYRDLYSYLARRHPPVAEEISQAYVHTMRWYYQAHFGRYEAALGAIKLHSLDKTDVLGQEDASRKNNALGASKSSGTPYNAFSLGRRIDLLKTSDRSALSSYLAEEDKSTHFLETPFRHFNLALIDNASAEYAFLTTFFASTSFHQVSRKFNEIFEPTSRLGQSFTKSLIDSSVDSLGVLICVRLNQHFAFHLQRRKVPTLDSYINGTNMLLWPRFQMIMDMQSESVKRITSVSNRSAMSTLAITSIDSVKQSAAPHLLTQRFAQLLQGILTLSSEAGDDEPIASSLGRLRNEYEAFIQRLSKAFGDKRKRDRFLFNNYSLVLTIIEDTTGKLAQDQKEHFADLAESYTE